MIMTRSGAPLHGALGEGRTWIWAAPSHGPGAAFAGDSIIEKMNAAIAAAAIRLAKSIFATLPLEQSTARGAADLMGEYRNPQRVLALPPSRSIAVSR